MEWTLLHYKYTFLKSFWGKHLFTILWLTKKKVTLDNGRMWRYEKLSLFKHECYLGKSQHFTYSPIFCKLEGFWTLQSCFKFHGNILVSLQSLFADVCVICEIEASYIVTWTQVNLLKLLVAFLLAYCIFLLSCLHCHLWFSSGLCFFFWLVCACECLSGILLNTLPPVLLLILESMNCLTIFCLLSCRYTGKILTHTCDISYVANTVLLLNLLFGIG